MTISDKTLGYCIFALTAIFLAAGYISCDISDARELDRVGTLLYYALLVYLPTFPLLAIVFVILTNQSGSMAITGANMGITILVTIFAITHGILERSWICMTIASSLPFIAAQIEHKRKFSKR